VLQSKVNDGENRLLCEPDRHSPRTQPWNSQSEHLAVRWLQAVHRAGKQDPVARPEHPVQGAVPEEFHCLCHPAINAKFTAFVPAVQVPVHVLLGKRCVLHPHQRAARLGPLAAIGVRPSRNGAAPDLWAMRNASVNARWIQLAQLRIVAAVVALLVNLPSENSAYIIVAQGEPGVAVGPYRKVFSSYCLQDETGFTGYRPCGPMGHTVRTIMLWRQMLGNRHKLGKRTDVRRPHASVLRALTATGAVALSIWSLNLSGSAGERAASSTLAAGFGTETATSSNGDPDALPSDRVGAGLLQASAFTNPGALVTFPHSAIGGYRGENSAALRVGTTGVGRPPSGFLMAPLTLLNASSPFGFRVSPLSGAAGDFHLGQDYAAPCGTSVYAADSGLVRAAGWHPWGGGNRVEIDHGNGLITTYNHLEAIAVSAGEEVNAGQVLGKVGSTGWSTGCHLHFETILDGRHTSPMKWALMPARPLDGSGSEEMRSYLPGFGSPSQGTFSWALPLGHDHNEPDEGGVKPGTPARPASPLLLRPAVASGPIPIQPTASPSATSPAGTPSASALPAVTTQPSTPTPTPTPTPPSPSVPSPTPTPSPSPTPTPTPTPSPTPTPTPSPTQTSTLTPAEVTPSPIEPTPSPLNATSPESCPAEPAPETTSLSPDVSALDPSSGQLLEGAPCENLVRDPADPA